MAKNLLDKATDTIPGFGQMYAKFRQYMLLLQRSEDTIRSYSYRFAHICIRFGKLPDDLTGEQLNDYLEHLLDEDQSHSRSYFKQVVYAIKMYYRFRDIPIPPGLVLPKIKEGNLCPVRRSSSRLIGWTLPPGSPAWNAVIPSSLPANLLTSAV